MQQFASVYENGQWAKPLPNKSKAQLVLAFGNRRHMLNHGFRETLIHAFPNSAIVGCTTSGEILGSRIYDDSICLTAIEFKSATIEVVDNVFVYGENAQKFGVELANQLPTQNLKHVLLISDGQQVNGTELVEGISTVLPGGVSVTGGLAGDDVDFNETIVWHNNNVQSGLVVLIGFYGDDLQVGYGHMGGWRAFGPLREITKSKENVLYELDGKPALELYKQFLGPHAEDLPASALLFPLALHDEGGDGTRVRTILSIDEHLNSMVFAGNMPSGDRCQLMRSNNENLIDGASGAAEQAFENMADFQPELALLVSCVGRRIVLKQRCEDEIEAVTDVFPESCSICGFYSYGEVSPSIPIGKCGLHNQTMTITLFSESQS